MIGNPVGQYYKYKDGSSSGGYGRDMYNNFKGIEYTPMIPLNQFHQYGQPYYRPAQYVQYSDSYSSVSTSPSTADFSRSYILTDSKSSSFDAFIPKRDLSEQQKAEMQKNLEEDPDYASLKMEQEETQADYKELLNQIREDNKKGFKPLKYVGGFLATGFLLGGLGAMFSIGKNVPWIGGATGFGSFLLKSLLPVFIKFSVPIILLLLLVKAAMVAYDNMRKWMLKNKLRNIKKEMNKMKAKYGLGIHQSYISGDELFKVIPQFNDSQMSDYFNYRDELLEKEKYLGGLTKKDKENDLTLLQKIIQSVPADHDVRKQLLENHNVNANHILMQYHKQNFLKGLIEKCQKGKKSDELCEEIDKFIKSQTETYEFQNADRFFKDLKQLKTEIGKSNNNQKKITKSINDKINRIEEGLNYYYNPVGYGIPPHYGNIKSISKYNKYSVKEKPGEEEHIIEQAFSNDDFKNFNSNGNEEEDEEEGEEEDKEEVEDKKNKTDKGFDNNLNANVDENEDEEDDEEEEEDEEKEEDKEKSHEQETGNEGKQPNDIQDNNKNEANKKSLQSVGNEESGNNKVKQIKSNNGQSATSMVSQTTDQNTKPNDIKNDNNKKEANNKSTTSVMDANININKLKDDKSLIVLQNANKSKTLSATVKMNKKQNETDKPIKSHQDLAKTNVVNNKAKQHNKSNDIQSASPVMLTDKLKSKHSIKNGTMSNSDNKTNDDKSITVEGANKPNTKANADKLKLDKEINLLKKDTDKVSNSQNNITNKAQQYNDSGANINLALSKSKTKPKEDAGSLEKQQKFEKEVLKRIKEFKKKYGDYFDVEDDEDVLKEHIQSYYKTYNKYPDKVFYLLLSEYQICQIKNLKKTTIRDAFDALKYMKGCCHPILKEKNNKFDVSTFNTNIKCNDEDCYNILTKLVNDKTFYYVCKLKDQGQWSTNYQKCSQEHKDIMTTINKSITDDMKYNGISNVLELQQHLCNKTQDNKPKMEFLDAIFDFPKNNTQSNMKIDISKEPNQQTKINAPKSPVVIPNQPEGTKKIIN